MSEERQLGRHRAYDLDEEFIRAWQWGDPLLRNVTDLMVASLRGRTGRALDVGCGTGRAALALAQMGFEVDAVDIEEKVIAIARRVSQQLNVHVNYQVADFSASAQDYAPGSYDVVVCMEVLEHVPDWQQALVNLLRMLKPGGALFLTVPHDPRQFSAIDEYAGHLRRFQRQEILEHLQGWDVDVYTVGFPTFRTVTWVYDRALHLLGRKHAPQALRQQKTIGPLMPRIMYLASKFDNLFNRLGWGTTLIVQATSR